MTYYYKMGQVPHKRHTQFRQPDGTLYHEEVMGIHGFAGIQSILYHRQPPTQIKSVKRFMKVDIPYEDPSPLRPRHLYTADIQSGGDAITARMPIMGNSDVVLYLARPTEAMDYWYRFAHGDDVIFIHEGSGVLESQFGTLAYGSGDYLVIPTGAIWRILPDEEVEQRMLVVEAFGHVVPPKRYLNWYGQFLENAPYCERDIRPPDELVNFDEEGEFEVRLKARNQSPISSPSPAGSTNLLRFTRLSTGRVLSFVPLSLVFLTIIPRPSRRHITTQMLILMKFSTMSKVISCLAKALKGHPLLSILMAFPMVPIPVPMRVQLVRSERRN